LLPGATGKIAPAPLPPEARQNPEPRAGRIRSSSKDVSAMGVVFTVLISALLFLICLGVLGMAYAFAWFNPFFSQP
jgi:hypothetical protein